MPSLDYEFLSQLTDDYRNYKVFVETGTHTGQTIFKMEEYFDNLFTVECSEYYYNHTKEEYSGNKINFILGDSSVVFGTLLPTIEDKCIFFLDGHYSSGPTGRGNKDCPLLEEITHIANLFKNDAIIIIDDYRLFGLSEETGCAEDWSEISKDKILDILSSRINKSYHLDSEVAKDDRLVIHINRLV
jgi:hypothetical protein